MGLSTSSSDPTPRVGSTKLTYTVDDCRRRCPSLLGARTRESASRCPGRLVRRRDKVAGPVYVGLWESPASPPRWAPLSVLAPLRRVGLLARRLSATYLAHRPGSASGGMPLVFGMHHRLSREIAIALCLTRFAS